MKGILLLLPDCPGYFVNLFLAIGRNLKSRGYTPVFAITSPFYEEFKKVSLAEVGKVYYLNEMLDKMPEVSDPTIPIDHWSYYASFSRQSYYFGKPLNSRERLRNVKRCFRQMLTENNVVGLASEGVSNSMLYLAFEEAHALGIPFFGFAGARIPYYFNIHLDIMGNEVLANPKAAKEYVPSNEVPDYMKNSQFGGIFDRKYSLISWPFLREVLHFLGLRGYRSLETGNTKRFLLKVYWVALRRMIADFYFRKIVRLYVPDVPFDPERPCVVYPLHYYPEASTSVFAKYYDGNEYNLIKNIAFSLPENAMLVVKEHRSNVGNNTRGFYRNIQLLPNVVLLDPYYKLRDNLEKFDAVVTLSGTVGFEALTMNVPVFVLGEVFYQKYPGSTKITSYAHLEQHMSKIGMKKVPTGRNDTFTIYSRMCFPGSFNYMDPSCLNSQNISLLVAPVVSYLEAGERNTLRND